MPAAPFCPVGRDLREGSSVPVRRPRHIAVPHHRLHVVQVRLLEIVEKSETVFFISSRCPVIFSFIGCIPSFP